MITDLRSFLKVSCHTKFRFAEREAQCILGECGPLRCVQQKSFLLFFADLVCVIKGWGPENLPKKINFSRLKPISDSNSHTVYYTYVIEKKKKKSFVSYILSMIISFYRS